MKALLLYYYNIMAKYLCLKIQRTSYKYMYIELNRTILPWRNKQRQQNGNTNNGWATNNLKYKLQSRLNNEYDRLAVLATCCITICTTINLFIYCVCFPHTIRTIRSLETSQLVILHSLLFTLGIVNIVRDIVAITGIATTTSANTFNHTYSNCFCRRILCLSHVHSGCVGGGWKLINIAVKPKKTI